MLAARLSGQEIAHHVWRWAEEGFDLEVAIRYAGKTRVIYGMENSSKFTFSAHKRKGGICVLRQINGHILDFSKMLVSESERYSPHLTTYQKNVLSRIDDMVEPRLRQIDDTDLIIGNSSYVYNSFRDQGVSEDKLAYVPTGVPEPSIESARAGTGGEKLRFVYASTLSIRKGIGRLLDAWRTTGLSGHAELHIFGRNEFMPTLLNNVEGTYYHGHVSGEKLKEILARSDVFVLPTLSEGRSHAVLEAVSAGLPVITTKESGCDDVVKNVETGLIVERRNTEAIQEALEWCMVNRGLLVKMGAASRQRASIWPIEQAKRAHLEIIQRYMENGRLGNWQESLLH